MVTKIKFQPNCLNFLKFRAVYTVVVVICAIIPIIFLIDPMALPSQIDTKNTDFCVNQDVEFTIKPYNAEEITIKGPIGITKIPASWAQARPYQKVCKLASSSSQVSTVNALIFKNIKVVHSDNPKDKKQYKLKLKPGKEDTVYPSNTTTLFRGYAEDTYSTLTSQQSIASSLLAVIVVAAIVIIVFIWFSCEGWCDCESPWKSPETAVGESLFV